MELNSTSKIIGYVLKVHLDVPSVLQFKDFQLVFNFNLYHDKSPSNWYMQGNKDPRRYAWTIILSIGILVNSILFRATSVYDMI